jgi:hypothetical protein
MKTRVFLGALAGLGILAAGTANAQLLHQTAGTPGMRRPPQGSLGSGFAGQPGSLHGTLGGPVIHGTVVNGTQQQRRKH